MHELFLVETLTGANDAITCLDFCFAVCGGADSERLECAFPILLCVYDRNQSDYCLFLR
jgi:hypothetical protein